MGAQASQLPESGKMRRLVLAQPNPDMALAELTVEEVDIPVPKSGEVLIRVTAAPVNPSDYGEWRRPSTATETKVQAIGKEGSGVVVASGGGLTTANMVGKKVGFSNLPKGQGSYSEYVTASALMSVFPMPDKVKVEDACSFFVNPYTAYGLYDTAVSKGSPGMVHTAAASQLGQMLVNLTKAKQGFTLINVVRRQEQADMLKGLGAQHVVVTDKEGWQEELGALIKEHKITVAADAIAGEMSGRLLALLPYKGTCVVYGGLSSEPVGAIHPLDLIYREKVIEGWLLPRWLKQDGQVSMLRKLRSASLTVNEGLLQEDGQGWSQSQFVDCSLHDMWPEFLKLWTSGFTNKKLRIRMDTVDNIVLPPAESKEADTEIEAL